MPDTFRLSAALSDRYRIERELGQGGMATVYLARDLKHDREVALKVLRPELGAVLGPDRFLAEIKITARLDHPHILTLIDSGAEDGFLYYVLPLVRGESLRDKLNREQQLSLDEALAITKQVASALDYAHRQGVIHRDIKPENILIQEGEAMLTDFGIALAVKQAGGNRLTETGLSLGTPQYMSPEQATGDRTLDARSDVYSLGAVLYEMLAGEPPVTGPNAQAMIAKLMTERPTALRVVRDTVPVGIDAAVAKALSKVPADRFPSASEFAVALAAGNQTAEPVRGRSWPVRPIVAVGLLIAVLAVWWIATRGHRGETSSPFLTAVPTQLTTSGRATFGVVSPDGSLVAYMEEHCGEANLCRGDLVVREIDGEGINTIVSLAGHRAFPAAWSPDGRWVLYMDADLATGVYSGPYLVSQRGGAPRLIGRGNPQAGGFVAPDTLVLASFDLPQQWCRRVVASTGQVIDSVRLPVGRFVNSILPSPDGTRLLVSHHAQFLSDSATWSVIDRDGHAIDSLRLKSASDVLWDGGSGAVVLGLPIEGGPGRALVRRRLDGRGRFLPGSDTLRIVPEGYAFQLGVGPHGQELVYTMTRAGTTEAWTATRTDTRGAFARGRLLRSSTGTLNVFLSPAGGWILISTAAGASQTRIEVEPFTGGERRVVEPALSNYRELAFSPADDSMAVATDAGPGRTTFTDYPLPSGAPALRGSFDGVVADLEWLSDGRLATAVDSGRVVRVFDRAGTVQDIPVPDSLGAAQSAGRSPFAPELALVSFAVRGNRVEAIVSRLDVGDGHFTTVARSSTFGDDVGNIWWTTDGWLHLQAGNRGAGRQLYRVPITDGAFEAEPPIGFASNAEVVSLSHDGRRAIVRVQSQNTDLWVLRSAAPK